MADTRQSAACAGDRGAGRGLSLAAGDASRSSSSAARSTSSRTSSFDSENRPSTWADTISGSVESGRPDSHADAVEVGAPQLGLQRLEPVVAGQPAAQPRLDAAERQVDLVVHRHHPVEVHVQRAARRARPSGRRRSCRSGAAARPPAGRRARCDRRCRGRRSASWPCGRPHRSAARAATSKPTLWRVRAYFSPGLPRPTTSQSTLPEAGSSPPPLRRSSAIAGGASSRRRSPRRSRRRTRRRRRRTRPRRPRPAASPSASGSPSSPTSSVSSSISGSSTLVGGTIVAMVNSSGFSARNSTPSHGRHLGQRERAEDLHVGDVDDDAVGNVGRQCLDLQLAGHVLEHAALGDAGRLLGALELDAHGGVDLLVEVAPRGSPRAAARRGRGGPGAP